MKLTINVTMEFSVGHRAKAARHDLTQGADIRFVLEEGVGLIISPRIDISSNITIF
jgi:hypothetical protein